jgi:hypothetical protein
MKRYVEVHVVLKDYTAIKAATCIAGVFDSLDAAEHFIMGAAQLGYEYRVPRAWVLLDDGSPSVKDEAAGVFKNGE